MQENVKLEDTSRPGLGTISINEETISDEEFEKLFLDVIQESAGKATASQKKFYEAVCRNILEKDYEKRLKSKAKRIFASAFFAGLASIPIFMLLNFFKSVGAF